jgi:hypothetical protein
VSRKVYNPAGTGVSLDTSPLTRDSSRLTGADGMVYTWSDAGLGGAHCNRAFNDTGGTNKVEFVHIPYFLGVW